MYSVWGCEPLARGFPLMARGFPLIDWLIDWLIVTALIGHWRSMGQLIQSKYKKRLEGSPKWHCSALQWFVLELWGLLYRTPFVDDDIGEVATSLQHRYIYTYRTSELQLRINNVDGPLRRLKKTINPLRNEYKWTIPKQIAKMPQKNSAAPKLFLFCLRGIIVYLNKMGVRDCNSEVRYMINWPGTIQ